MKLSKEELEGAERLQGYFNCKDILEIIKGKDDGIAVEDIYKNSKVLNKIEIDKAIMELVNKGEVFEIKPKIIKAL